MSHPDPLYDPEYPKIKEDAQADRFEMWIAANEDDLRRVYAEDYGLGMEAIDQIAFDKWAWARWQDLC